MSRKPFGALVTALDVERLQEDSGPTHFVRVCGALIRWALVEHGAPSANIQISERLNVPDRGVDAEPVLATKRVVVWGSADIANALTASPGLRHLFAAAGGLSTVEVAEAELRAAYGRVGWVPFVNRARELSSLREFIQSDAARIL